MVVVVVVVVVVVAVVVVVVFKTQPTSPPMKNPIELVRYSAGLSSRGSVLKLFEWEGGGVAGWRGGRE